MKSKIKLMHLYSLGNLTHSHVDCSGIWETIGVKNIDSDDDLEISWTIKRVFSVKEEAPVGTELKLPESVIISYGYHIDRSALRGKIIQ